MRLLVVKSAFSKYDGMVEGEFQVSALITGDQSFPSIGVTPSGDFMVVWENGGGYDGSATGVVGRVFDSSGSPLTAEFVVNDFRTGNQRDAAIAADANGNFVVVWESYLNQDYNAQP